MTTIAWLLILIGAVVVRQVNKGRASNLGEDLTDLFTAGVSGDTKTFTAVLARTGDANTPTVVDDAIANTVSGTTSAIGTITDTTAKGISDALTKLGQTASSSLALAAVVRGERAKGYKWAATGPDYYDCSGLIWRACQDIGYKGVRFATADVQLRKGFTKIAAPGTQGPGIKSATVSDIVLWPGHHMGVIVGNNQFYSARSVKSGIGVSSITGFRDSTPIFLRYTP